MTVELKIEDNRGVNSEDQDQIKKKDHITPHTTHPLLNNEEKENDIESILEKNDEEDESDDSFRGQLHRRIKRDYYARQKEELIRRMKIDKRSRIEKEAQRIGGSGGALNGVLMQVNPLDVDSDASSRNSGKPKVINFDS